MFLTTHPEALESDFDLNFLQYNQDDLQCYRSSDDSEGIVVRCIATNTSGSSKEVMLCHHTRANMENAVSRAGLRIAAEKELWIDVQEAEQYFGLKSVREAPSTPTFWLLHLMK